MVRTVFAIAMMLILSANARAERLNCATMIALGSQSVSPTVIIRMRLEIGLQWSRATGEPLADGNFDKIIFACVEKPSASIQHVIQTVITPVPGTQIAACAR